MSEYVWTRGCSLKVDAQAVGDRLDELQRVNGERLVPRVVVNDGRADDSPLHHLFEWNDSLAAEAHREDQARYVLRSIRIVREKTDDGAAVKTVHAYVSLVENFGDEKTRGYIPIARVMSDVDLYRQACEQAARELRACEDKYAEFSSVAGVIQTARVRIQEMARLPLEATA